MDTLYLLHSPSCHVCKIVRKNLYDKNYKVVLIDFFNIVNNPNFKNALNLSFSIPAIYKKENDKYIKLDVLNYIVE